MLNQADVTACLVTRGDQPKAMRRIQETLIFPNVIVWDNSVEEDWKVAGRYQAAARATTHHVYFQDDDCVVPPETQQALLAEYNGEDCVATWGHDPDPDGYDDLPLVHGGAIARAQACWENIIRYSAHWPLDDAFKYEADFIVGALYRNWRHVRLPFDINLDIAQHPSRMCNQPWQRALKYEITQRARAIRDTELVAA